MAPRAWQAEAATRKQQVPKGKSQGRKSSCQKSPECFHWPTLIRGAEDAPQGPRIALPGWPLRQPNDATTRACGRHARSVRGGPRRAVHIVPAPWARQLSSSVAEEMCLPSFRRWPDQDCDALSRIALPPWLLSGRRGTGALDLIARPASLCRAAPWELSALAAAAIPCISAPCYH